MRTRKDGRLSADELDYYAQTLSLAYAELRVLLHALAPDTTDPRLVRLDDVMRDATARLDYLTHGGEPTPVIDLAARRHRVGQDEFSVSLE